VVANSNPGLELVNAFGVSHLLHVAISCNLAAVRRKRQSKRFIVISLFEEDGMGDTGTAWILPLAPEYLKETYED
ncbi:MAG TPA: hypothetical protein VM941_07070, partial [Pyrinomonadaceae bacterium]|nr:hypothetical protein [Pyrinomonadaceae bacterium]